MAPLPVIGNCVRVAMQWNASAGVRPVNVFHLITASTDESAIRDALDAAWQDATTNPWAPLHTSFNTVDYLITLLDGTSAGQVIPSIDDPAGSSTGGMSPAIAAVLSFHTPQRGPRGRGRLYLGPMGEADYDNGLVGGTLRTETVAAWNEVNESLADSPIAASLGVASYVHAEVNGVTSISMRQQLGTMRRRQDQLV